MKFERQILIQRTWELARRQALDFLKQRDAFEALTPFPIQNPGEEPVSDQEVEKLVFLPSKAEVAGRLYDVVTCEGFVVWVGIL